GALFGVTAVSLLFALITLHELGHSFAAQYFGVPVKQIVLSPIGGVAQLSHMPEKPVQEFVIAIAGPAVNVVVAGLMWVTAVLLNINISNPLFILLGGGGVTLTALFAYVFVYNIFLAAFNLIPAFPMDGGRVLRSLLAMRLDFGRATAIAAAIGRGVAALMGLYALFNGAIFLGLIAIFIFTAAGQENRAVKVRSALRGYVVQQAYAPSAYRLSPYHNLQHAVDFMLMSGQSSFPVCQGEQYLGFVTKSRLEQALQTRGRHTWVSDIMRRDIQPVSPLDDLYDVQKRMETERMDALPVVKDGRCLGIVTRRHIFDLFRLAQMAPGTLPKAQSA
ncbi:MAG: site-2 protease family protein, partial [Anaerolineae bacterium]